MKTKVVILSVLLAVVSYFWLRRSHHFDPKSIENQRILVTGASSGIGEQLVYQYAKLGARLVITARREPLLKEVAKKCQELGAKQIEVFPADMGKPEDRAQLIKFTQKALGGLDQLILNHAIMRLKLWVGDADNDLDNLRNDLEVNFLSSVDLATKALPMLKEVKGRIGVVSSTAGKLAIAAGSIYSTTKFALQGFFSSLQLDLLYKDAGVSVTVCTFGFVDTEAVGTALGSVYDISRMKSSAVSAVDAAEVIMKAVDSRVSEVYHPFKCKLLVIFDSIFAGYISRGTVSLLRI